MTDSDTHHLVAAQGWLELGLLNEAFDELDNIEPQHRAHPNVLKVRWNVYHVARKWMQAAEVARELTQVIPDEFDGWWMLSFALHELKRTQEAYDNLAKVSERFKDEHIFHYNTACYLTQLGRLNEARTALEHALVLNPEQRQQLSMTLT
jgi:tetratricopeptide (TPR) repeat protein